MTTNYFYQKLLINIQILIGTILTAAAFGLIIVPQGFSASGVTGLSCVLKTFIPLPVSMLVLIINCILLILGLVVLGYAFIVKTIAVSLMFPVFLELFSKVDGSILLNSPVASIVCAGSLLGVGAGMILRSDASSGGFDILGIIFNKKFNIPIVVVMYLCDSIVIIAQAVTKPIMTTVYGLLVILICNLCIEMTIKLPTINLSMMFRKKELS